ncbi:MAG: serine/threonine protein kinase [Anaerolineae bacterium]|nr:serine/threonine protein kinase [Anaerolineae bacterium]
MPLTTGQVLQNRYRVVALLGQGGMGAVYRAWDTRLNAPVAIKEMVPQTGIPSTMLAQLRQQFRQEAMVLGRLSHPNLVRVTDFFEEAGNAYLVMEFVQGESLASYINRMGALPEGQVVAWARQLLDTLTYCHSQGVLHRDIKPQNVILRADGQLILVDFGLVKLWDASAPQTQTMMRGMGSPEYAPPEQYGTHSQHTDPRSDLYSLGATLYHALTGYAPPTATDRIVRPGLLTSVRQFNPQASPALEAALFRALELQPESRFQNAAEMLQGLLTPRNFSALPLPSQWSSKPMPARAFPWPWAVVAALVVVGLCVGGGIWAWRFVASTRTPSAPVLFAESTATTADLPNQSPTDTSEPALPVTEVLPSATPVPPAPTEYPTTPPTSTPVPTNTPYPTATKAPTPTFTPSCPAVTGTFASIWQARQVQLGCARGGASSTWVAQEHFERGEMFWREDTDRMLVLYTNGTWTLYHDIWVDGDPTYSCPDSAPQSSPPTPLRGFGKIWCTYVEVRNGLGNATDAERGFTGVIQEFDRGTLLRTDNGQVYMLYTDGSWTR